jgi:5'-nucleotidase
MAPGGVGRQGRGWLRAAALLAVLLCGAQAPAPPVHLRIIAINDMHGNLEPQPAGFQIEDEAGRRFSVDAGGAERMATLVKRLRAGQRNSIFVAAGDLVGASPPLSGLFHNEPTIETLNRMGLQISAVGNHEFDKGAKELLRLQRGGCHPTDGCTGGHVFKGASFQYLAASTVTAGTNQTILPPYVIRRFEGIPVAFIGLTREGTSNLIPPYASAGLEFRDEAATVNALVPKLKAQGVEAIVLLIHMGGSVDFAPSKRGNGCDNLAGAITQLLPKLDRAVDPVISGDSHFPYICTVDGRLVTQAFRYSTMVTAIDLDLDRRTRKVVAQKASNYVVDPSLSPDPSITDVLANYRRRVGPLVAKVIANLPAPVSEEYDANKETPLGDLIADAELAATNGAQIAFINKGGIRVSLEKSGPVTYGDLFAVLPFGNQLVSLDLTGAQLKTLLEQQWSDPQLTKILQVSKGFHYEWDGRRATGDHIIPGSMTLNGAPIRPDAVYRIVTVDFVADGGDGYAVMREGKNRTVGGLALDALVNYLPGHVPPNGDTAARFRRMDR